MVENKPSSRKNKKVKNHKCFLGFVSAVKKFQILAKLKTQLSFLGTGLKSVENAAQGFSEGKEIR